MTKKNFLGVFWNQGVMKRGRMQKIFSIFGPFYRTIVLNVKVKVIKKFKKTLINLFSKRNKCDSFFCYAQKIKNNIENKCLCILRGGRGRWAFLAQKSGR